MTDHTPAGTVRAHALERKRERAELRAARADLATERGKVATLTAAYADLIADPTSPNTNAQAVRVVLAEQARLIGQARRIAAALESEQARLTDQILPALRRLQDQTVPETAESLETILDMWELDTAHPEDGRR